MVVIHFRSSVVIILTSATGHSMDSGECIVCVRACVTCRQKRVLLKREPNGNSMGWPLIGLAHKS